jgi:hypothetical protein
VAEATGPTRGLGIRNWALGIRGANHFISFEFVGERGVAYRFVRHFCPELLQALEFLQRAAVLALGVGLVAQQQ